jgi:tyrosyl-tRNA synthetase
MSSSEEDSKIDLLDPPSIVKKKIKGAFCEPGNIENNGLLAFSKHVLIPMNKSGRIVIERPEKWGGNMEFADYDALEQAFKNETLHPGDLKAGVEKMINDLLAPIRKDFESPENIKLTEEAYPVEKKKK